MYPRHRRHCAIEVVIVGGGINWMRGGLRIRGCGSVSGARRGWVDRAGRHRGAMICERSPVTRICFDSKGVKITTEGGTLRAQRAVIATGSASPLVKPLERHLRQMQTYAVMTPPLGAKIRAELGQRNAILWDTSEPYHYLRWTRDNRVLFGGAGQPPTPSRQREKILVQRTGQLMYELSMLYPVISGIQPEQAWDGIITTTSDGLPYIGPHRNYPNHLFALGYGGNGLTLGFLASRVLLRYHMGAPKNGDELFGFGR